MDLMQRGAKAKFVRIIPVLALSFVLALPLALSGCAGVGDATSALDNPDPPEKMFTDADAMLSSGDFENAAKKYEDLERNYPFSNDPQKPYARKSLALAAFAYYKAESYDEAIASAHRYLSTHAGTEDAPLAQHVLAMSYYDQMQDAQRDQSITKNALTELRTVVRLYPASKYADQDRNRLRVAEDGLAASEMNVGRFYLKKGQHLAAINRFKTVISEYQTTAHTEEALMRLTEAYMALGIQPEAQAAAAILGHNFPNSQWYKDAYDLLQSDGLAPRENAGSAISQAWNGAVKTLGG